MKRARSLLSLVPLLLLLLVLLRGAAADTNAYQADDLLVLVSFKAFNANNFAAAATDDGLSDDPLLQLATLLTINPPEGFPADRKLDVVRGAMGDRCLLPFIRRSNPFFFKRPPLGHLALSADGRFVSFACVNYMRRTPLSQIPPGAATWTLALRLASGENDFSTSIPYDGYWVTSVVTDDGTGLWFTSGNAVYYTERGAYNPSPVRVYASGTTEFPMQQVQIFNGTALWVARGNTVSRISVVLRDPRYPRYPLLPRTQDSGVVGPVAVSPYGAVGVAPLMQPRGGNRGYGYPNEINFIEGSEQVVQSSSYIAVAHYNYLGATVGGRGAADGKKMVGSNVYLYAPSARGMIVPYRPHDEAVPDLTVHAGDEVLYCAGTMSRFLDASYHSFDFDPRAQLPIGKPLGSLFCTGSMTVFNYTLMDQKVYSRLDQVLTEGFTLHGQYSNLGEMKGIAFAPFNATVKAFATSLPSVTATPSPNASKAVDLPTFTAVKSLSPTASVAPISEEVEEYGQLSGPPYANDLEVLKTKGGFYLLLTRVGGNKDDLEGAPAGPGKLDFRMFAGNLSSEERVASRPIFVDSLYASQTNQVTYRSSQQMPTKRVSLPSKVKAGVFVEHKACTTSFSTTKMWPKLYQSERKLLRTGQFAFSTLFCYDSPVADPGSARTYENIVPDQSSVPQGATLQMADWWARAYSEKHPKRTIANLHSGGAVDTRTVLRDACIEAATSGAILAANDNGAVFFISTAQFADAAADSHSRCGLRFAPFRGSDRLNPPQDIDLVAATDTNANENYRPLSSLAIFNEQLYAFASHQSRILRMYNGPSEVYSVQKLLWPGAKTLTPVDPITISKSELGPDVYIRSFVTLSYDGLGINSFLLVNVATRPSLILQHRERSYWTINITSIINPPDNRTAVDAVPNPKIESAVIPRDRWNDAGFHFYVQYVFIVTAELQDGPNYKSGSSLWKLELDSWSFPKRWTLLSELPCCDQIWTGVMVSGLTALLPVPSPSSSPSREPVPSAALPSSPPFSERGLKAILVPSSSAIGLSTLMRFSAARASLRNAVCSSSGELVESPVNATRLSVLGGDASEADLPWDSQSLVIADGMWPTAAMLLRVRASVAMVSASKGPVSPRPTLAFFENVFKGMLVPGMDAPFACTTSSKTRLVFSTARLNSTSLSDDGRDGIAVFVIEVIARMNLDTLAGWRAAAPDSISCRFSSTNLVASEGTSAESAARQLKEQDPSLSLANMTSSFTAASSIPATVWQALWPFPNEYRIAAIEAGATNWLPSGCPPSAALCLVNQGSAEGMQWLSKLVSRSSYLGSMDRGSITLDGETIIIASRAPGAGPFPLVPGAGNLSVPLSVAPVSPLDLPRPPLEVFFGGVKVTNLIATADGQTIAFASPPLEKLCPSSFVRLGVGGLASAESDRKLAKSSKPCPVPRLVIRVPPVSASVASSSLKGRASRDAALLALCGETASGSVNMTLLGQPSRDGGYSSLLAAPGDGSMLASRPSMASRPGLMVCPPVCSSAQLPSMLVAQASPSSVTTGRQLALSEATAEASPEAFDLSLLVAQAGVADAESMLASHAFMPLENLTRLGTSASASLFASGSLGFLYSPSCIPRSAFPVDAPLPSVLCSNASDPRSDGSFGLCYYGAPPDDCRLCPPGGVCPGGYVLRSQPGYYVASEEQLDLPLRCSYPSSERCVRWDYVTGTTLCGDGYAGLGCELCSPGFYRSSDSRCLACPDAAARISALTANVVPILIIGAITLGVGCCLAGVSVFITLRNGGTAVGGIKRASSYILSLWIALNLISTVARSAPSDAPPFVARLFAAFRALQGEGTNIGTVPLACTSISPLTVPHVILALSLALECLWFVGLVLWLLHLQHQITGRNRQEPPLRTGLSGESRCSAVSSCLRTARDHSSMRLCAAALGGHVKWQQFYRFCAIGAALLFAITTNTAMSLTSCRDLQMTLKEYSTLRHDGSAAAKALGISIAEVTKLLEESLVVTSATAALISRPFSVPVLRSDPQLVCGEGEHATVLSVAVATIILFSVGFPLASYLVLRYVAIPKALASTPVPDFALERQLCHVAFGGGGDVDSLRALLKGTVDGAVSEGKETAKAAVSCWQSGYSEKDVLEVLRILERRRQAAFIREQYDAWHYGSSHTSHSRCNCLRNGALVAPASPHADCFVSRPYRSLLLSLGIGNRYLPRHHRKLPSAPRRNSAAEAASKDGPEKAAEPAHLQRLKFRYPESLQSLLDEETGKGVDNEGDPFETMTLRSFTSSSAVVTITATSAAGKRKQQGAATAARKARRPSRFQELQRGAPNYSSDIASAFSAVAGEMEASPLYASSPVLLSGTAKRASVIGTLIQGKRASVVTGVGSPPSTAVVVAPFGQCGVLCCRPRSFARDAQTADDLVDSSLALTVDNSGTTKKSAPPLILAAYPIIFFTGSSFRPSKFFFLHLDWAFIVCTCALNTWIPQEGSTPRALTARGATIFTMALLVALANFLCLPDALISSQQLPTRLLIILLSGLSALYTGLASAGPPSSVEGLAYIVVILCLLLPFALLLSFVNMLSVSAKKEKLDGETRSRAFASARERVKQVVADLAIKKQKEADAAAAAAKSSVAPNQRIYVSASASEGAPMARQWQQESSPLDSTRNRPAEEGRIYVAGAGSSQASRSAVTTQQVHLLAASKEGLESQYRGTDGAFQALNPLKETQAAYYEPVPVPFAVAAAAAAAPAPAASAAAVTSITSSRGSVVSLNPLATKKRSE